MSNKISAVVCSKNDNANNYKRIILTLNNLIDLYDEVIFVDYGSESETFISYLGNKIKKSGKLKCIKVSPEFCKSVSWDKSNKFIEVYARNIGIRRASGDFIVSTNQDIISDLPKDLRNDTLYTVRRYNYPEYLIDSIFEKHIEIDMISPLEYFKSIKHTMTRQPRAVDDHRNATWEPGDIWSLVVSCGDYQIAHRNVWNEIKGFEESMTLRCFADSNLMKKAEEHGFKINVLDLDIFHLDHQVNVSSGYALNNKTYYINDFTKTKNPDTWGFYDNVFEEEIL